MNKFKAFWVKAWNGFKHFWISVWNYIKYLFKNPKEVLIPTLAAELVFWAPVWVCAIFAFIFSPWWWGVVTGVIAFWAGPFTPAIPLQLGLIAAFERIWNKIRKNKNKKGDEKNE